MECKETNLTPEESQAVNDTVKDILLNSIEEVKCNHNYNPESRRCEKCGKHIYDNLTPPNKKEIDMEIKIVKSIPQWIISSDIAAYHPFTKTIWIKSGMGLMFIPTLFHEIGHWVIHKIFNNNKKYHKKWDMTTIGFGNLNYSKEINRNVKLLVVVK